MPSIKEAEQRELAKRFLVQRYAHLYATSRSDMPLEDMVADCYDDAGAALALFDQFATVPITPKETASEN